MQKGHGKVEDRIRDRYNGVNDPLAKKIIDKIEEYKLPDPPADLGVTTFFVGGVTEASEESELRAKFGEFGKVEGIKMITSKKCAFVCFFDRREAEKAFEILYERLYLGEKKLKLLWAKSQLDLSKKKKKKSKPDSALPEEGKPDSALPKEEKPVEVKSDNGEPLDPAVVK
uniref:RRM domain-containing protein n=1 Tax=Strombidium inclinatum TaxID=197538 RepID=A0A7S3IRN5_9SPIT|mmetsp:Transcript_35947/g.55237  ORF Transcript_35947/g.55237 Transcript_35947/m.55237 type:complete len:171 (+) Transcript_35947:592-1104(+)